MGYNPHIFPGTVYTPLSVTDCPSPAYNTGSSTVYPDPERSHSRADQVSLSEIETPLTNDTLSHCEQHGSLPATAHMMFVLVGLLSKVLKAVEKGSVTMLKS